MPPESPRVAEARPWFTKAAHDLQAAELLLTADPPLLGEVAFHCQQAEEELRRGLLPIAAAFDQWRAGKLGSGKWTEIIHEFHDGRARELWKQCAGLLEFAVAHANVAGQIEQDTVPAKILDHSRGVTEFLATTQGD